jgi:hypothetical protein
VPAQTPEVTSDRRISVFDWLLSFPVGERPVLLRDKEKLAKHARATGVIPPRHKLATAAQWAEAARTFSG